MFFIYFLHFYLTSLLSSSSSFYVFSSTSMFVVFYVPTSLTSLYTSTYLFADDIKLQDFHLVGPIKKESGCLHSVTRRT
jgi:hypothetical protein